VANIWLASAVWIGLALLASLISIRIAISVALLEILVGALAGNAFGLTPTEWVSYLAGVGAIVLTFLAGAEIDPVVVKRQFWPSVLIGLAGFLFPFLGVLAYTHCVISWSWQQALIAGIALSTTSIAVVYAVMIETGFNRTEMGKVILAACFVNDLGTVVALGIFFANYNVWLALFGVVTAIIMFLLPRFVPRFFKKVGNRASEPEIKFILLVLFLLGGLGTIAKSEAVLPAYLIGMILAPFFLKDKVLAGRMRTIIFTLFTPFYFIKAGALVKGQTVFRGCRTDRRAFASQDGHQVHWHPAADEEVPLRQTRRHVHHAHDVYGPDVRHDLGPVWPHQQDHRPGSVYHTRHSGYSQRGRTDADRPEMVPAETRTHRRGGQQQCTRRYCTLLTDQKVHSRHWRKRSNSRSSMAPSCTVFPSKRFRTIRARSGKSWK